MHTISFEDLRWESPTPCLPTGWNGPSRGQDMPIVRIHRAVRRRRTDLSWIPLTLFALAALAALCVFALQLVESHARLRTAGVGTKPSVTKRMPPKSTGPRSPKAAESPAAVVRAAIPATPAVAASPSIQPEPMPRPTAVAASPDESRWVDDALHACRERRYDEAQSMADQAMRRPDGEARGRAVWLLVEYLRQYDRLSREAIDRMNGAVVVDLGPDHGIGAFVERDGDELLFQCRGGHKRLTVDELCGLEGVRFRITSTFLANSSQPANDLILAAVHIVHRTDESGIPDADGARALESARGRLLTAASAPERDVAEHANLFLSLIDG